MNQPDYILFFDGSCNFCNSSVKFVLKRDRLHRIYFSSLESDYAVEFAQKLHQVKLFSEGKSLVFFNKGEVYIKSKAVLELLRHLDFPFPLLYFFKIIPAFISDIFYDLFARNRHRFFKKKENCRIFTQQEKSRFLN